MANFDLFKGRILQIEGGYQDDPDDSGNYDSIGRLVGTNYGISAKRLEDYRGRSITVHEMKNLTVHEAVSIYKKFYWDKHRMGDFQDQDLSELVCDGIIHHGPGGRNQSGGVTILQKALNEMGESLTEDGIIGSETLAAVDRQTANNKPQLYNTIRFGRLELFDIIVANKPSKSKFLLGWQNRINNYFPALSEEDQSNISPKHQVYYYTTGIKDVGRSDSARREWAIILCVLILLIGGIYWYRRL